ncbi:MAG: presqualene diphosphate synthase HpnD [Candidatus Dormibacteraceae bacterium]
MRITTTSTTPEPEAVRHRRAAERACARITRREAKNFYLGFLALPRPKRIAIYSLYSFARQVDDEVDDAPGPEAAGQGLARQRARLEAGLRGVHREDPVMQILAATVDRFGIPASELLEIIEGVEMDLRTTRYETWDELSEYCRRVAGAVGRMCTRIFGADGEAALHHADNLGLALQLTNILRDVLEDASMDRVYLPLQDLQRHGLSASDLVARVPHPESGWEALVAFEVDRARGLYQDGLQLCEQVPKNSAACLRTMAGIYEQILDRIAAEPRAVLSGRVSLSMGSKLGIAARSWLAA